jgi:hypothetical protein
MARRLCWDLTACHGSRSCSGPEAARTAILYAFDLIEHNGEDLRDLPFLDRKAALAGLLRDTAATILLNEHIARGPYRLCARLPVRRRGHRIGEGRWRLSVRPLPRLN